MARSKGTSSGMWPETLTSGPVASLFSRQCLQWTSSRKQEQTGKTGKILKWEIRLFKDSVVTFVFFLFFPPKTKAKSKVYVRYKQV